MKRGKIWEYKNEESGENARKSNTVQARRYELKDIQERQVYVRKSKTGERRYEIKIYKK